MLALGMAWLCSAASSSGGVVFYADDFQSYPVQNPAPSPLTNGPAGGQWFFLNPIPANGITADEHRVYQTTTAGCGCNSIGWISDTNNAGLSNRIVVTTLPPNTNVAIFTLSWLAATDTSTTNRDCRFAYTVTSSTGSLGFLSGSNLDGSQLLSGLHGDGLAKAGNFGKAPSRQFQLVFAATNLTLGSTIQFTFTRITNALSPGAFIFLDDVSLAVNSGPPPTPYAATSIFVSGQGYPEYRIPAMVTTTDGTVIAIADGRQGNGDIPNPIDCVCRRSFDNGNTWGPLQVIANYGSDTDDLGNVDTYPAYGLTNAIPRTSAGDSALLLDRTNGRVWVLYDNGAPAAGVFDGRAIKLELRYSDDNGAMWSSRIDVEALNPNLRLALAAAPEFLTGPGNGIQLSSGTNAGRLIFPVYIYGSPYYSAMIYSDNHGANWQLGGNAGTGGGEVQMVETPGGGLLASMRDNDFPWSGIRTFSRSTDGGLTWGALFTNTLNPPVIPDPECQGSILRLTWINDSPIHPASRLVLANCDSSTSSRVAMTLRISYDEGQSWPVSNLVYSGVSGYSSLTRLANGCVGLLNEVNNYARIDFVRRSVSVISGGTDTNLLGDSPALNLNISPAGNGSPSAFGFLTLSNNTYTIQGCTNLATGGWQRIMDVSAQTTNSVVQLLLNSSNPMQFFRLITPQLP